MGTANDKSYDTTHDNLEDDTHQDIHQVSTKILRRQQLYCT